MSIHATITQYARMLNNLDAWLQAAVKYAEEKKFDPEVFAQARLAPDQYALVQQVQSACDAAKYAAAYLSGQTAPSHPDTEKTVADSMARQGLVARRIRRRNGLTRQDATAPKFPDLLKRDFTATAPNCRWVGDMTEIPTEAGKLYLATVIDLYSRRLLGAATGLHPDAQLARDAITMAVATRGGKQAIWRDDEAQRVIFHTDRGSTYTAKAFTKLCRKLGIRQSMGRVGSCFDNAAAEAFFSSLEWEVLSRHRFADTRHAQAVVLEWCYGFYNHTRRHSSAGMMAPITYETTALNREAA